MYFLKTNPEISYENLPETECVDAHGNSAELNFRFNQEAGNFEIHNGDVDNAMAVTEGLYELAVSGKEPQAIRIDFSKSRARRVKMDKIKPSSNGGTTPTNVMNTFDPESIEIETTRLRDVNFDPRLFVPIKTGTYLDGFLSRNGGLMPGINIMLTGDPGVGKSSNLMDILVNVKKTNTDRKVLYISAEMSEIDVKEFEQYYPGLEQIDFLYIGNYISDPNLNIKPYQALLSVLHQGWDLIVMDSLYEVQSMIQDDLGLTSKKSERWLLDLMNKHNGGHNKENIYSTFLCIQQKNKSGSYVGSKRLEHMTSAFLNLCWDKKESGRRYMIFEKNRKGKEKVKLYYSFSKTDGIVYDENRHTKELEIFERLQSSDTFQVEELKEFDLEKLFEQDDESAI